MDVLTVFLVALGTAPATGLGALPFVFTGRLDRSWLLPEALATTRRSVVALTVASSTLAMLGSVCSSSEHGFPNLLARCRKGCRVVESRERTP